MTTKSVQISNNKFKYILCLRILGDSASPWNNLFGDSVKKRKTTREFSGICILFPVVQ